MTQAVHVCVHWIRLYMYACTDRLCHPMASPPPKRSRRPTHRPRTQPTSTYRNTRTKNTPTSTPRQKDRGTGLQAATVTNLTKTNNTRPECSPAVPPNNTCVRLFVENYSNLTAEARRDTMVRLHDLMAAEPVVTVRARCCDLTMLTVSNTRPEFTARARR
jgi:hypothetical protein